MLLLMLLGYVVVKMYIYNIIIVYVCCGEDVYIYVKYDNRACSSTY